MQQQVFTAAGQILEVSCHEDLTMATIQLAAQAAFVGANFTFEGRVDPNGPWVPVEAVRNVGNTNESVTGALSAEPAYFWDAVIAGLWAFRVRCTALTSGQPRITIHQYKNSPENAQFVPTHAVTLSGTMLNPPAPTPHNLNSAATTNATSVKTSAGSIFNILATNANAAVRYLKLYNKASAPVVGTDVPIATLAIPAAGSLIVPMGVLGKRFSTGIAYALTTGVADSDTGAVAANEIKVAIDYL